MTQYDQLSDRELDALVAEKVMGAQCSCHGEFRSNPHGMLYFCKIHGAFAGGSLKPYASDISAAMSVVEKLSPSLEDYKAGAKSARFIMQQQDSGKWSVEARSSFLTSYDKPVFSLDQSSLPRAIVLAALAAVGGEEGK